MSRPEDILPPDLYYNDTESQKYTTSSRIQSIQTTMTNRALQLLSLPRPSLVLDIGCGSGLSGEILTSHGHTWVGLDISPSMLAIALDRDVDGDLLLSDIGQGLPFRPGSFDAAVSISAIQWLCNADSTEPNCSPFSRLNRFFNTLYMCLKRGSKAVCQFYPKDDKQRDMITSAAISAGFGAGILIDDAETKNQKLYLILTVGKVADEGNGIGDGAGVTNVVNGGRTGRARSRLRTGDITDVVAGLEGVEVHDSRGTGASKKGNGKEKKGSKRWILRKKEQARSKGKVMKADSKYTGRKRKPQF